MKPSNFQHAPQEKKHSSENSTLLLIKHVVVLPNEKKIKMIPETQNKQIMVKFPNFHWQLHNRMTFGDAIHEGWTNSLEQKPSRKIEKPRL